MKLRFIPLFFLAANLTASEETSLARLVDTKIGANSPGSTVVGPQVPQGSINPSPDGPNQGPPGHVAGGPIWGFSQAHVSGTGGIGHYGNLLISPMLRELEVERTAHILRVLKETGTAGYYSAKLDKKDNRAIEVEITSTHHAALYRFKFPAGERGFLKWDPTYTIPRFTAVPPRKDAGLRDGAVEISRDGRRISGWGAYVGGWSHFAPYRFYYTAEFDREPAEFGSWSADGKLPNELKRAFVRDETAGVYFRFDQAEVLLKVAISFSSQKNASAFLKSEIPGWEFDQVRAEAEAKWNRALSVVTVNDATMTPMEKKSFVTALYHCNVMPRDRSADSPWETKEPFFDDHYAIWDTYRTLFPLYHLVYPELAGRIATSFASRFEHNGLVSDSFVAGNDGYQQGGDNVDVILSDAYLKKVPGVDWERVYMFLISQADKQRPVGYMANGRGWIPNGTPIPKGIPNQVMWGSGDSVSKSIEYSYADFSTSLVAKGIGRSVDAQRLLSRSRRWDQLWNPDFEFEGYRGFLNPKSEDGVWITFDPNRYARSEYFYEGTTWIYSMYVPHEMKRLVEFSGGPAKFIERLQHGFQKKLFQVHNEPSFLTCRLFHYAGRPDLSSRQTRDWLKHWDNGKIPGNDDSGAMSSWYLFTLAGLFPVAGQDVYLLTGPRFSEIRIKPLGEAGKPLVIIGRNTGPEHCYVQSATLNGKPITRSWLRHSELAGGGELLFEMGPSPSNWAHSGELPPSY